MANVIYYGSGRKLREAITNEKFSFACSVLSIFMYNVLIVQHFHASVSDDSRIVFMRALELQTHHRCHQLRPSIHSTALPLPILSMLLIIPLLTPVPPLVLLLNVPILDSPHAFPNPGPLRPETLDAGLKHQQLVHSRYQLAVLASACLKVHCELLVVPFEPHYTLFTRF